MKTAQTVEEMLIELTSGKGGIGLIPTKGGIRVAVAVNSKNPEETFDQINQLEVALIKASNTQFAGNETLTSIVTSFDRIRKTVIESLEKNQVNLSTIKNLPKL